MKPFYFALAILAVIVIAVWYFSDVIMALMNEIIVENEDE